MYNVRIGYTYFIHRLGPDDIHSREGVSVVRDAVRPVSLYMQTNF